MINSIEVKRNLLAMAVVSSSMVFSACSSNSSVTSTDYSAEPIADGGVIVEPEKTYETDDTEKMETVSFDDKLNTVVFFSFDSAEVLPEARQKIATALSIYSEEELKSVSVTLEGHTDALGTKEYNQKLSEKRIEAVKVFISNLGMPVSDWDSEAYGEAVPVASNETEMGREQNRRVEVGLNLHIQTQPIAQK